MELSSLIFHELKMKKFQSVRKMKKKKKTLVKCFLYLKKWNFLALENLIKLHKEKQGNHQKLEQPLNFTKCSSIQFFNSPPFPNSSPSQAFPIQLLPREAEDFPRGGRYFNHMSLLT